MNGAETEIGKPYDHTHTFWSRPLKKMLGELFNKEQLLERKLSLQDHQKSGVHSCASAVLYMLLKAGIVENTNQVCVSRGCAVSPSCA